MEKTSISSRGKKRLLLVILVGTILLAILFFLSLSLGNVRIPLGDVYDALGGLIHHGPESGYEKIIYNQRIPKVIATFAAGMGLAVAGVVFQAIIRNPLVDPYMTGVSSGAGFGATIVIIFGANLAMSAYMVPLAAFIGALVAFAITFIMATAAGGRAISYVLGGVMTAMAFGALTTMLMMINEKSAMSVLSFLFGSFSSITWNNVWIMTIPIIILSIIIPMFSRSFNVALLGEEQSKQLGLDYNKFKLFSMITASMLTAFCVAFVGIIGFVGLVVPHLCRMVLGGDHRLLFPASMIIGGVLMCTADIISRLVLASQALPVGAVMTLIGVPFFAFLLIKRGKEYAT